MNTYFSPAAVRTIADKLGVEEMPEGSTAPMTLSDLSEYIRASTHARQMRPQTIAKSMEAAGAPLRMYITKNNQIVMAYDYDDRDIPITRPKSSVPDKVDIDLTPGQVEGGPNLEVISWLSKILVDPTIAKTAQQEKAIRAAQSCLILALREEAPETDEDYEYLALELTSRKAQPTEQMKNVMKAKELSFAELVMAAVRAKNKFDNMNSMKIRRGGKPTI